MAAVIVIVIPVLTFIATAFLHQSVLGNYGMIVRWQAHRYLLRQSMSFYADEFAGRVAAKVMQTSLAVRDAAVTILEVLVFVVVYFVGAMVVVASFDWRLSLPFMVWLLAYIAVLKYFLPKMSRVARMQANARSLMTGRVVDSYTNISTVKLFSHASREEDYARESMDEFLQTVHPQMRFSTQFEFILQLLNGLLLCGAGGVGIWLWINGLSGIGGLAVAVALVLRLNGMAHWIMWETARLFENIGIIHDGMDMLTIRQSVVDAPGAGELTVSKGGIHFDQVKFHYGKDTGVIDDISLAVKPGEKVGLVGRSGAGKTTLTNVLLRFYDLEAGKILIDGQDISMVTQDAHRRCCREWSGATKKYPGSPRRCLPRRLSCVTIEMS